MAFVEDTINEILEDATGLVTLAYDVEHVGHNRYTIIPPQISIQTV